VANVDVSTARFGRAISVQIARVKPGSFIATLPNAIVVRRLRMQFEIEKTLEADPNPATLTIWNLNEATRTEVQRKPLQICIEAGYGTRTSILFIGDMQDASTQRQGADLRTKILIADGERCMNVRVNRAFAGGTGGRAQITEIAATMGLRVPRNVTDAKEFVQAVASGGSLQGPARRAMTDVTRRYGATWSIQDGQLQILRGNEVRADQALVISEQTGMLGSPELGSPGKKGEAPTLTVRHLLYPECKPGGKINLQAEFLKGLYRIEKVKHSGDTHAEEWLTTLECKQL